MNYRKIGKRIAYWTILILLIILNGLHIMDRTMQYSDQEIKDFFQERNTPFSIDYLDSPQGKIRVIESGSTDRETAIVAIHGAPGSWDAYKSYLIDSILLEKTHLISYDRPGYGINYRGGPVTSLEEQAIFLRSLIQELVQAENIILLSHSYGGPIAAKYMSMYPDKQTSHIMIAPAIDPATEKYFWVSPLGYWTLTKWVLPDSYISASYEKCTHEEELDILKSELSAIRGRTFHIHGMEDWLAPPRGNLELVEEYFPDSLTYIDTLKDAGHLLIWDQYDFIRGKILKIVE